MITGGWLLAATAAMRLGGGGSGAGAERAEVREPHEETTSAARSSGRRRRTVAGDYSCPIAATPRSRERRRGGAPGPVARAAWRRGCRGGAGTAGCPA